MGERILLFPSPELPGSGSKGVISACTIGTPDCDLIIGGKGRKNTFFMSFNPQFFENVFCVTVLT